MGKRESGTARSEFWSGRWESNPRPHAAKRLKMLVNRTARPSNSVQHRRNLLDGLTVRIAYNVTIDLKRRACARVSELTLRDFGCCTRVEKQRRVSVPERMKSATRNPQRIKQGPKTILDNFVRRRWPVIPSREEKATRIWFPRQPVTLQNRDKGVGDRKGSLARLALGGLDFAIPCRPPNVHQPTIEVDVLPLKP